jgi:hypothetical protein
VAAPVRVTFHSGCTAPIHMSVDMSRARGELRLTG